MGPAQQSADNTGTTVGIVVPVVLVAIIVAILGLLYWRTKGGAFRHTREPLKAQDVDVTTSETGPEAADTVEYGGNSTPRDTTGTDNAIHRAGSLRT